MIDVGVGGNDGVQILERQWQLSILVGGLLPSALKHPAIQRDRMAVYMKEMAGARDFSRRTDKRYLQLLTFRYGIALKQNR